MKLYITFGQDHVHRVDGKTLDADCVAVIECEDERAGRDRAFELFGPRFCTSHDEERIRPLMHYFPRGQVEV